MAPVPWMSEIAVAGSPHAPTSGSGSGSGVVPEFTGVGSPAVKSAALSTVFTKPVRETEVVLLVVGAGPDPR